jgi:DNA recombination protein RmuC
MQNILPILCFIAGFGLAWLLSQSRISAERNAAQEKLALIDSSHQKLADSFTRAQDAITRTQESARNDLELRQRAIAELVTPVRDSLSKVDYKIQELERARVAAYAALHEQVRGLTETQSQLRTETGKLVSALRNPNARGRWGEVQLQRVVELAGMKEHCDFQLQGTFVTENGRLRPDLLIRLPANRTIVVDAKTPLSGYLQAMEASDEATRKARLADHARQVKEHITSLGRKSYWEQFAQAPEFAVLFLPGECFFSAALESDPELIEFGMRQRVILATPTTLIALLRAVAYGWQQESLARNARDIGQLGKDLFQRISTMADHWNRLGRSLEGTVKAYNSAMGSLEDRVMVSARRFADLKTVPVGVEIAPLEPVERNIRGLERQQL